MISGDIVVTERSPTHQVQIFNQYGQFVRKFGANVLQHPRGVTVDHMGRIIIVECKVGSVTCNDEPKFGCGLRETFSVWFALCVTHRLSILNVCV